MEITAAAVPEVARPPRLAPATVAQALIPSRLLTIAVFILSILVLLLLADRFFVFSLRPGTSGPVAPVTSQNPQIK
jgi:hypothetical protein